MKNININTTITSCYHRISVWLSRELSSPSSNCLLSSNLTPPLLLQIPSFLVLDLSVLSGRPRAPPLWCCCISEQASWCWSARSCPCSAPCEPAPPVGGCWRGRLGWACPRPPGAPAAPVPPSSRGRGRGLPGVPAPPGWGPWRPTPRRSCCHTPGRCSGPTRWSGMAPSSVEKLSESRDMRRSLSPCRRRIASPPRPRTRGCWTCPSPRRGQPGLCCQSVSRLSQNAPSRSSEWCRVINLQLDKVEVNHTAQRWHSVCVQHNQREGCGGVQGHQLLLMNEKELRMFD